MLKKIAKIAAGLFLGAILTLGVKESVDASIMYIPKGGVIYGLDPSTGFFAELPAGTVIPAGAIGNATNLMISYKTDDDGEKSVKLTPTMAPGLTAEAFIDFEYQKHAFAFAAKYPAAVYAPAACALPQMPQMPAVQLPQLPQMPAMPCVPCYYGMDMSAFPYYWMLMQ